MAIQRDICPQCGKNVGMVRIHKCVPVEPVTESWLMPATKAVAAGLSVTPAVTKRRAAVTKAVTPVTKAVTPVTKAVTRAKSVTPAVTQCAECERLKAEIGTLKAQLVEALKGMPKPMTAAERMRRMRAARAKESDDAS
jgi:hypothetical protein